MDGARCASAFGGLGCVVWSGHVWTAPVAQGLLAVWAAWSGGVMYGRRPLRKCFWRFGLRGLERSCMDGPRCARAFGGLGCVVWRGDVWTAPVAQVLLAVWAAWSGAVMYGRPPLRKGFWRFGLR